MAARTYQKDHIRLPCQKSATSLCGVIVAMRSSGTARLTGLNVTETHFDWAWQSEHAQHQKWEADLGVHGGGLDGGGGLVLTSSGCRLSDSGGGLVAR